MALPTLALTLSKVFDGFLGFKNRKQNAILRATATEARNFRVADSLVGVYLLRNMLGGFQLLEDSLAIG